MQVTAGFDVASALQDDDNNDGDAEEARELFSGSAAIPMPRRLPIDQPFDQSIRNSPFYSAPGALSNTIGDSEVADRKQDNDDLADLLSRLDAAQSERMNQEQEVNETEDGGESQDDEDVASRSPGVGNSLLSSTGWSTVDQPAGDEEQPVVTEEQLVPSRFSMLVASHRKCVDRPLNPAEVWQRFESSLIGGEEQVQETAQSDLEVEEADEVSGRSLLQKIFEFSFGVTFSHRTNCSTLRWSR